MSYAEAAMHHLLLTILAQAEQFCAEKEPSTDYRYMRVHPKRFR